MATREAGDHVSEIFGMIADLAEMIGVDSESGHIVILVCLILLVMVFFMLLMRAVFGGRAPAIDTTEIPGLDQLQGLGGKFERLENTLNIFKTDILRHRELGNNRLDSLKDDLEAIKAKLEISSDELSPLSGDPLFERTRKPSLMETEAPAELSPKDSEKKNLI